MADPTTRVIEHPVDEDCSGREPATGDIDIDIGRGRPVVVGIAPYSVRVAAGLAHALEAPLDTAWVQPLLLKAPDSRFGVAAEGGVTLFDRSRVGAVDSHAQTVDAAIIAAQRSMSGRSGAWHRGSGRPSLHGRAVLLIGGLGVDAEMASAAACAVRDRGAAAVTYAAPEAEMQAALALDDWFDAVVCLETLSEQVGAANTTAANGPASDEEIHSLLSDNVRARRHIHEPPKR